MVRKSPALRAAQQDVSAHRPLDAGLEAPDTVEEHERDGCGGAGSNQGRRNEDGTEGHDRGEQMQGHRAFTTPSTSATRFSLSFRKTAPSVVT